MPEFLSCLAQRVSIASTLKFAEGDNSKKKFEISGTNLKVQDCRKQRSHRSEDSIRSPLICVFAVGWATILEFI